MKPENYREDHRRSALIIAEEMRFMDEIAKNHNNPEALQSILRSVEGIINSRQGRTSPEQIKK